MTSERNILNELQKFATKALIIEGYDLTRIKKFLNYLGNPQDKYKVIHITGTAGKGSTSYHLSKILAEHGLKVGTSVSPHIYTPRERIQVNTQNISTTDFAIYFDKVKAKHDEYFPKDQELTLTYFEFLIVMGFVYFADQEIDVLVLEVGLGGRLDPTNVVNSSIQIITNVGLDHVQVLGNTLEKIATDKSGIIKAEGTVITGVSDANAREIILQRAATFGSKTLVLGEDLITNVIRSDLHGSDYELKLDGRYFDVTVGSLGKHQVDNSVLAIAAAYEYLGTNFKIDLINTALGKSIVPGRMELIKINPYIFLDTAHNNMKIRASVETLLDIEVEKDIVLLLAFKKGKSAIELLEPLGALKDRIRRVILTKYKVTQDLTHYSEDVLGFNDYLQELLPNSQIDFIAESQQAFKEAKDFALQRDLYVWVTGSFYLIDSLDISDS